MRQDTKILHICSYYLGTKLYQKLFDSLEENNIEEDIYVFTDNKHQIKEGYPLNVKISRCYNNRDRYIFHIKHLKVLKDIQNKIDIPKYDIIHAHSLFSNGYIAYKLYEKYNIPYIVAVRNTDVNLFFKKMIHLRSLGVKILKNAKKVIFISEPYKEHTMNKYIPNRYRKEIKKKSVVIPNGIDQYWFNNKPEKIKIPSNKKINLIYVGTLNGNKNIETTTKACEILIKQGYEVNYKIIGKIKDKKYNEFINRYPFIQYIPHCLKEKLIKYYRSSDIFVMPSKHETFGLVYAEAMSQGLPVIYTRGQGFDGQFKEGEVGYSVQYDSAEEIVDKIINILKKYAYISNRCIINVDKFDWDRIAKKYSKFYEKN